MQSYYKLLEELEQKIKILNLEKSDIHHISEQGIKICLQVLDELRKSIIKNPFKSETYEIDFYKNIKPRILSKLIYFVENFNIEIKRPKTSKKAQTKYLNKYIDTLQNYFNNNSEFYNYYKRGATHLDEQHFLSKNAIIRLNKSAYQFITDKKFSTNHDISVATIMAYEKLIVKLKLEINKLKTGVNMNEAYIAVHKEYRLNWTGHKTDLIELIYALHSSGAINSGTADIKEMAAVCEQIFNIDLGNYYHTFVEIRARKSNNTKFLDKLKKSLIKRYEESDE